MIVIFNKRELHDVILVTIWHKAVIRTVFKYPVQHRFEPNEIVSRQELLRVLKLGYANL